MSTVYLDTDAVLDRCAAGRNMARGLQQTAQHWADKRHTLAKEEQQAQTRAQLASRQDNADAAQCAHAHALSKMALEAFDARAKFDLETMRQQAKQQILRHINAVLPAVAQQVGATAVRRLPDSTLVYLAPQADITVQVIAALDQALASA